MKSSRFVLLSSLAALALAALWFGRNEFSQAQDKSAPDKSAQVQLMFVQNAENIKVDPAAKTLRLVKVNPQTLYFSDRPERIAGHMTMADYLKEWTDKAGKDNFGANPPNAALSVYEPGQPDSTLAVVKITNPVMEGADLVYNFTVISGKLPATGGASALFIDWIAYARTTTVYRGVGVGVRGFGFR